jgi:hypothetical protein
MARPEIIFVLGPNKSLPSASSILVQSTDLLLICRTSLSYRYWGAVGWVTSVDEGYPSPCCNSRQRNSTKKQRLLLTCKVHRRTRKPVVKTGTVVKELLTLILVAISPVSPWKAPAEFELEVFADLQKVTVRPPISRDSCRVLETCRGGRCVRRRQEGLRSLRIRGADARRIDVPRVLGLARIAAV